MSVVLPSNTSLAWRTGTGPDVYTAIPGVFSADPGGRQADIVDTTDFDSPGDSEESESGIFRSQNGSFEMNYDPGDTVQEAVIAAKGQTKRFRITDEGQTDTFDAVIVGISKPRQIGQKRVVTVTIKLTGDIVTA